jgi:hypothetical protein
MYGSNTNRKENQMYEDMTVAELYALADQAEAMGRGLMKKAFDLRVQAKNKDIVDIINKQLAKGASK